MKKTLAGLYKLTQFNDHIYFVMITSLLGVAASRGQFDWRFFILLPANALTVNFAHMLVNIIEAPHDALYNNPISLNPIATGLISPGASKKSAAFIGLLSAVLFAILGLKPLLIGIMSLFSGLIYSFRVNQRKHNIFFVILLRSLVFAGFQYLCSFFTYTSSFNRFWFWPFVFIFSISFFHEGYNNSRHLKKVHKNYQQRIGPNPENRFSLIMVIFVLSFGILSAIITFLLINLIPNWTVFLTAGLSLIFIIPSVLEIKKGAAHRTALGLFLKPLERAMALALLLGELLPWLDNLIGSGIFS